MGFGIWWFTTLETSGGELGHLCSAGYGCLVKVYGLCTGAKLETCPGTSPGMQSFTLSRNADESEACAYNVLRGLYRVYDFEGLGA